MISRETADHYLWGGICDGWRLLESEGLSVISERMPPGTAEIRHYHEQTQQFFYVLRGTLEVELNERLYSLHEHQGITIPVGVPHQAFNHSQSDVDFLVISQPPAVNDRIVVTVSLAKKE